MSGQVTDWVTVETLDGGGQVRADHGMLHLSGFSWAYLTPVQWEVMKEIGDNRLAGVRGRKAVELATEAGTLTDLADYVSGTFPFPEKAPAPADMTDAEWGHVARVLRDMPGQFGLLKEFWDAAGKALSDGE